MQKLASGLEFCVSVGVVTAVGTGEGDGVGIRWVRSVLNRSWNWVKMAPSSSQILP